MTAAAEEVLNLGMAVSNEIYSLQNEHTYRK